ncbi:CPBP family intramembrane glutamic endopeptidase [Clostridium sp. JN-9]|uniref:CPBP family intramembrane glutamic endopeptidase n=1 Tax=Clostridium sp. JN-9 TaxID=2507159 RepID=UPI0013E8EEC8|nr:CPBP family intramembrane glutamic endopeptidase [Clostridium sp. JN-9]
MKKIFSCKNILLFLFIITILVFIIISPMIYGNDNKLYFSKFKTGMLSASAIILCMTVICLFLKDMSPNYQIYSDKNALLSFIPILIIYISVIYIFTYRISRNLGFLVNTAIQVFLVCCILIMYLFHLKFSIFKWSVTFKELLVIILAFLCLLFPRLIIQGKSALKYYSSFNKNDLAYLYYSLRVFIYPAFNEEVIFRGLLITGLKGYGFEYWKINIVQSVIFGLLHFGVYKGLGFIAIVLMGSQIIMGFILGIIYYKTKSLTPCILFHALIDIV